MYSQNSTFTYAQVSVKDFIRTIVKFDSIDEILNTCKTQSEKGFVFERLFDIVIKFGFCDIFPTCNWYNLVGNSNNASLKILENLNQYVNDEKVISGNSGGCSDITLQNKADETYIFITCKLPIHCESVEYYDIQNIIAMAAEKLNMHIYKNYKIYLAVSDKASILEKVANANQSSNYITNHICAETVLDNVDLQNYFAKFKMHIATNLNADWNELYVSPKAALKLRFHQELITHKTCTLIKSSKKSFLWGCKCRSGKTYMIGGIIVKQAALKSNFNVLIITPAPTETMPQFTDDLFNKFRDFNKFKIHNIESGDQFKSLVPEIYNIFVASKQLLQNYTGESVNTTLRDLNLDIIAFDENHYGGVTDISKAILTTYSNKNTVKIYLTATYNKPLQEWDIPHECQMYWDIEDEQICKSIAKNESNLTRLKEKHGKMHVESILNSMAFKGQSVLSIFSAYENMPELCLLTNMFDQERYNTIKQTINDSCYGFSFDVLFTLHKGTDRFEFDREVKMFLRYISGSHKYIDFPCGDKSIFTRIDSVNTRKPFTQIWFLPSKNIDEISKRLKLLMVGDGKPDTPDKFERLGDPILKNYEVLCINSKNDDLARNIKLEIAKRERVAKSMNKAGLILLAGNMLNLGITISSCDVVMLLNNTLSADRILQQMYRCMTEGTDKKCGFVVDLNISRVLHTCINYTIYDSDKNKTIEDKMKYIINNNLINIDRDMMESKELDGNTIIKKLMDIWKGDPINSFKSLLRNLDNDYIAFDNNTQKLLNASFSRSIKDGKFDSTIIVKNEEDDIQNIPSGKSEIAVENNADKVAKDTVEFNISFTKDVLPFVIPLESILTINNFSKDGSKSKDFTNMLQYIKNNRELLEIFDDQSLIWWNRKDLIGIIHNIIEKYFDKSSNAYNITMQLNMSIQSLIDSPKELLELIAECLKPKDVEKKKFGEVFTPMQFINDDMLGDLEKYWMQKTNTDIWNNEMLTYYDPAAGMGNYSIAIFYKLMNGLREKMPDVAARKKHIIEKQLFMGELNRKNCFVIKQIFNMDGTLNLNLYVGDTLKIDLQAEFKREKFDIIIGNPPYNEEFNIKSNGAAPLYHKFIEYYVNKCRILSFITPSRWFSTGKCLNAFREMMLNRKDLSFIKHFDDASKIFGNKVDIKGGVSYFIIDKEYNGLCNYNGCLLELHRYDIVLDAKYYSIVNKINHKKKITDIYQTKAYYGIESNDKRLKFNDELLKLKNELLKIKNERLKFNDELLKLKDELLKLKNRQSKDERITPMNACIAPQCGGDRLKSIDDRLKSIDDLLKSIDEQMKIDYIVCYVSMLKSSDRKKYIEKSEITADYNCYKIITVSAAGVGSDGFGNIFIGEPNTVYSASYISFKVSNENEAKSLLSYMKCRLPHFMLSLRKISQQIIKSTCDWIPLPPLDRIWDDDAVYAHLELSPEEIQLVKSTPLKGYNDLSTAESTPKNAACIGDGKTIIKDGRMSYYLIEGSLYKIKKDKSQGELAGAYVDGKVVKSEKIAKKSIKLNDKPLTVSQITANIHSYNINMKCCLIDERAYKIKPDGSNGEFIGDYISGKIVRKLKTPVKMVQNDENTIIFDGNIKYQLIDGQVFRSYKSKKELVGCYADGELSLIVVTSDGRN